LPSFLALNNIRKNPALQPIHILVLGKEIEGLSDILPLGDLVII
jgi:hypothetical protein